MKVYIATGLERGAVQQRVAGWLRDAGHEITYDWGVNGAVYAEGSERLAEVALAELNAVMSADVVLVLLPGGRGTHFEAGAAVVLGIPTVFWRESGDDGLFEADPRTCAFYHLVCVHRVTGRLDPETIISALGDAILAGRAE